MSTVLNTQTTSTASAATGSDAIGSAMGSSSEISDMFIKLLVAQVQNQNPLEPTDPAEFVGQLTQLSQMEAMQKLSDQSANQTAALASMQLLSLGSQVGSTMTVQSDTVALDQEPLEVGFTLSSPSSQTTLVLTNATGQETRIDLGSRQSGAVSTTLDPAALGLPAGSYSMRVATSSSEAPSTTVTGTLQSVKLTSTGAALLQVAGAGQVAVSAVTAFNGRSSTTFN
jgi:flagellar basal-body rod modification protein FlgD